METKTEKKGAVQGAETSKEQTNNVADRKLGVNLPAVTKKAMELPQVMKAVNDLYTMIRHRDKMELYEDTLKGMDIKKREEDLNENNYYHGCELIIKGDDGREEFKLRNPALIKDTVDYLTVRFAAKRRELEKKIVLPAA